jgi:hypothetical protein
MGKNWTRKELLRKLREADADDHVALGYPIKPLNLPKDVSKRWNEVAGRLYAAGLLWSWSTDAKLVTEYCTAGIERQREILHIFTCRQPNADPRPQITEQKANADYWCHFQTADIERLRLTPAESAALRDWVVEGAEVSIKNAPLTVPVPNHDWKKNPPGVPLMPEGLSPLERAVWKNAALYVLLGGTDGLEDALKEEGGSDFFVNQLIAGLPYLHRGLKPRV